MNPAVAAVGCLLLASACPQVAQAAGGPRVAPQQRVVALLSGHSVRTATSDRTPVAFVDSRRPITGERTVLPVLAHRTDGHGKAWLRVRLPGRSFHGGTPPRAGWISASNTRESSTGWHLVVDTHAPRVDVYHNGRRVRSFRAIVGKPSTPTPLGDYFVEENIRMLPSAPGAPFALATSARSNVLQEFDGGPGQIALHGLDNVGGQLGTAESHGCTRLADSAITWLAWRIAPGVPVTIY